MFRRRRTALTYCYLLLATVALSMSRIGRADAKTAVLFGATGAVGNDVFRALLANNKKDPQEPYFDKVILVGRRAFPPKVTNLFPPSGSKPEIVTVEHADLSTVHQNEELLQVQQADACFNAVGAAFPHQSDLHDWHFVEVTVMESIAKLCAQLQVSSLSIFTAIDGEPDSKPYSEDELAPTGSPQGWWPVLMGTIRMMRLKERAVISSSEGIPKIRIFQPSNIVTEELRYGFLDKYLFKIHGFLDKVIPKHYHSVTTQFLGTAMVQDAVELLSGSSSATDEERVTFLDYEDFERIVGEDTAGGENGTEL